MDIEISLLRVKEGWPTFMVRNCVDVTTWFNEIYMAVDLLIRVVLQAELRHFMSISDERFLVLQHSHYDTLPVFTVILLFCVRDELFFLR